MVIARVGKVNKPVRLGRRTIVTVRVFDATGHLDLRWFNQTWPLRRFREGQELALWGKVSLPGTAPGRQPHRRGVEGRG